ncbi:L-alanine-DL-glutamate epimerase-like enolase superfamily enzyme [Caldalkalibacillus uzonensis]|uniref:L-alanine-DL-glutamate epimerase-like enolase superfamily enzyme n=1 Tax=Caldalkalibacillus uzonensis TaxID=353224 RepID=A0ABU0CVA0_9BACI|nr:mandelate racemase/muconate lactonizing enzyme family protein [Caldalkalibacillus uzonensis]MDQ0340062.1 L-alanine-DL-glutamate epimerase-like enolase superfamily enzyme [Caldalkalibacillus uzonensis]
MKITAVETIQIPEHPHLLFVQIHTDEGITGLGETFPRPSSSVAVIHDVLTGLILGQNPFDIERLWRDMFQAINYHGYAGAELRALSAIDMALWDILGKASNLPVYRLLGGKCREEIPVYNTCVSHGPYQDHELFTENPEELAQSLLADGIRAMKIWHFDELSVKTGGQSISKEDLAYGVSIVERIRQAVGDKMEIAIEGHACWNLPSAIKIAKALEPYDVMWLEDLIPADNIGALRQLRNTTTSPICASERLFSRFQFLPLLQQEAVDIVMPDIAWVGGISEMKKIATLASAYQLPIAPHNCGGPIISLANAHICANIPNLFICESVRAFYNTYFKNIVTNPIQVKNGFMQIPEAPGIGAELLPELLKRDDLIRRVTKDSGVNTHWAVGDPWKDDLGNNF